MNQLKEDKNEARKFRCDVCRQRFRRRSSVKRHMKSHLRIVEEPICTHCGKVFNKKSRLLRHERTHLPKKVLTCPSCGRKYQRWNHHNKHIANCSEVVRDSDEEGDIGPVAKLENILQCLDSNEPVDVGGIGIPFCMSDSEGE